MGTPVLLVSTATQWLGTARIPRALAEAGFDVALLAPRNSPASNSRFVAKVGYLPDEATRRDWVSAFAGMVGALSPDIVIPCDDMAFRLLQDLAVGRPSSLAPALHRRLARLIRDSLGDPSWYQASIDKRRLASAAAALGVRVPQHEVVSSLEAAESFAAAQGYPIVLKRGLAFAGQGVIIVRHRHELASSFARLTATSPMETAAPLADPILVQSYIPGQVQYYALAAWKGSLLAGWAADKVVTFPDATGPSTVVRCHCEPEVRGFAQRLVRGFGMSGIMSLDCVIHGGTGDAYRLEINRRINPGSHLGSALGVDLCAALHAALHGKPMTSRTDMDQDEEHVRVLFPQEWFRDPDSPYLRDGVVDVPWDDPGLIEALLGLRHGHGARDGRSKVARDEPFDSG